MLSEDRISSDSACMAYAESTILLCASGMADTGTGFLIEQKAWRHRKFRILMTGRIPLS
jgi:hypothetical protein